MSELPAPIYVCGATASGKTAYALELAAELDGEIVNGDAFQLFRGIEVLSAAPSEEEKEGFPHHLFGVLEPGESCDAGRYAEMVQPVISEICGRGKTPVVVGGSGLYLKFLTHGPSPLPKGDLGMREEMEKRSLEDLLEELEQLDPVEAAQVNRANKRYVSRSLEICLLSGEKVSELRDGWERKTSELDASLHGVWLVRERADLHDRIARRTKQMLSGGAIEEALVLPEVERALLAERLLASLENKRIAFENEWLEESKDRFNAYKAGLMRSADGRETVAAIRNSLGK